MTPHPTLYIARHAETVFNANARMQGNFAHTPLTRRGIEQAEAMGDALKAVLGPAPHMDFWVSAAGRCQQTAAVIAEHLEMSFFDIRTDERLFEINVGAWTGRDYAKIIEEIGETIVDTERGLFCVRPPEGEWYPEIRERIDHWLGELDPDRPALVITHGITSRVLRGALVGGEPFEPGCVPIAPNAPQGTVFKVEGNREEAVLTGSGALSSQKAY